MNSAGEKYQDTNWDAISLPGKRLELIDPDSVQVLRFSDGGRVSATLGSKEAVAAPLLFWRIENDSLLVAWDRDFAGIVSALSAPRAGRHPERDADRILSVTGQHGGQMQYLLSQR